MTNNEANERRQNGWTDSACVLVGAIGLLLVVWLFKIELTEAYPGETIFMGASTAILSAYMLATGISGLWGGSSA